MALGAPRADLSQAIVGACHVDSDLVVQRAAANVVDLVDGSRNRVLGVPAVGSIWDQGRQETGSDTKVLQVRAGVVPKAAEGKGLLGAVLKGGGMSASYRIRALYTLAWEEVYTLPEEPSRAFKKARKQLLRLHLVSHGGSV